MSDQTKKAVEISWYDLSDEVQDLAERLESFIKAEVESAAESYSTPEHFENYFLDGWDRDHKDKAEELLGRELTDKEMDQVWVDAEIEVLPGYSCRFYDRCLDTAGSYGSEIEVEIDLADFPEHKAFMSLPAEVRALIEVQLGFTEGDFDDRYIFQFTSQDCTGYLLISESYFE